MAFDNYYRPPTFMYQRPPPPYPAPPLHQIENPSNEVNIKLLDKEFVKNWMSSKNIGNRKSSVLKPNTPKIFQFRKSIEVILHKCELLEEEGKFLRQDILSITPNEWSERLTAVNQLRTEIANENDKWKNVGDIDILKKKLSQRLNKRSRMKRRSKDRKDKKLLQQKLAASKSKELEDWLIKTKNALQQKQTLEEIEYESEIVLRDVMKRKVEARRSLSLLEALCKLRTAKEKAVLGCGQKFDLDEAAVFSKNIGKLKDLWNLALEKYAAEEKRLGEELKRNENNLNEDSQKDKIPEKEDDCAIAMWKDALFGCEDLMPQRDFNGDIHAFISIRVQWDQYVSRGEGSSTIPVGWVFPPKTPNILWEKYLMQES